MSDFRDRRGPDRQPAPIDDTEPAPEIIRFANSIQWEADPHLEARGNRMSETARRLKCEQAFRVMVNMMGVMDLATGPGNIYTGPSEKNLQETKNIYVGDLDRNEIVERAWWPIHQQYDTLALPNLPKESDWARAISTFHAAIRPAEGINGVLDVIAPRHGERGDEQWQKFFVWCNKLKLNAYNLWEVARELKTQGIKSSERDELRTKLEKLTASQLDQIVLAGFNQADDLKIWNQNNFDNQRGYKTLAGSQRDLDPIKKKTGEDAAFAAAEQAKSDYLLNNGFSKNNKGVWREPPALGSYGKARTREKWEESLRIYEGTLEAEYKKIDQTNEQAIQIMPASAAFGRAPAACIIARQGQVGKQKFGFGFHPVSPEMVAMIVGPEQLHALPTELSLSLDKGGQIVATDKQALTSAEGVVLTTNTKEVKNEEAVKLFAKKLADHDDWDQRKLSDQLKFMYRNEDLISEKNADQWKARSQGRLQINFDLETWYYQKLLALGNITTIAEAQTHAQDLTLTIQDVFADQKDIIAEVERDYPAAITLNEAKLPINYRYVSEEEAERDHRTAEFSATISIPQKEARAILKLPSKLFLGVGSSEQPLPLIIDIRDNWGHTKLSPNLAETQETLDYEDRAKAWEQYPSKDRKWKKAISIKDNLPATTEVVIETLEPYYTGKNNEPLYPTPGLMAVREQAGEYYALYGLYRTAKEAVDNTKSAQWTHKNNQERYERIQAITPEQKNSILAKIAKLKTVIEATDPENIYLNFRLNAYFTNKIRLTSGLERVEGNLESGYLIQAEKEIAEVTTQYNEEILEPWELFKEALGLQKILEEKKIGLAYTYERYFKPERLAKTDKGLLTKDELKKIVEEMKKAIAKDDEAKEFWRKFEEERTQEKLRRESLTPEELATEITEKTKIIGGLILEIEQQLKRPIIIRSNEIKVKRLAQTFAEFKERYQKILSKQPFTAATLSDLDYAIEDMKTRKSRTIEEMDRIAK